MSYAAARVSNVKRVVLLGAESTGKSTLAAALARRYGTVWNPEYGRPYTQIGREREAAWTSEEFTHIARIHCWYEDFLAELARDVLFVDTDAFTTAVFHEVYLGRPHVGIRGARGAPVRPLRRLRARRSMAARRNP